MAGESLIFPFTIILQSVEIFTSEERLPIYMRIPKAGAGTEPSALSTARRGWAGYCVSRRFLSLTDAHMCALCITRVTLLAKILDYAYLLQRGCVVTSTVIGYYCRYCMGFSLQLDLNLHFQKIISCYSFWPCPTFNTTWQEVFFFFVCFVLFIF